MLDKPDLWEFLLFIALTRQKLAEVRRDFDELKNGRIHLPARVVDLRGLPTWMAERTSELGSLIDVFRNVVATLSSAWGPDGESGDPTTILRTANGLADACKGMLDWEREVARAVLPAGFDDLRLRMREWTEGFFREMETIPSALSTLVEQRLPGQQEVTIAFVPPDGIEEVGWEFVQRFRRAML